MSLKEKIKSDVIRALKSKDDVRTSTLRMLLAAVHNVEIEKKGKSGGKDIVLEDDEVVSVVRREIKKRKEAIEMYEKGKRGELAQKEKIELGVLEEYVPPQMSGEEVTKVVEEAIASVQPKSPADFGKVMGAAMKQLKGRADASVVTKVVKDRLAAKSELT